MFTWCNLLISDLTMKTTTCSRQTSQHILYTYSILQNKLSTLL